MSLRHHESMQSSTESRHPLTLLVDEITRLHGRLKSVFAPAWREAGLGESELMVLTAVVEAERSPTVPQIGRSLGHPRQLVQRAANALVAQGLVETLPNPDHKRAALLGATGAGRELKRKVDAQADAIGAALGEGVDLGAAEAAAAQLRLLRKELETHLRSERSRAA